MKYLLESNPESLAAAAAVLQDNGVAAIPTETVYGLMTRWDNEAGRLRIYELKHRPANKMLQMLSPDLDTAFRYGVQDTPALRRIAQAFWPGALTAIVPAVGNYPTIGLRIPDHPFLLRLLRQCGCAFAATSANLSGEKAATDAKEAVCHLNGEPALCIDGGVITITNGAASTVVSLLEPCAPKILRQGTISLEQIQKALK